MALLGQTSDEQVIGDGQWEALESFEGCCHMNDFYDAEAKDGYKGVKWRCRYADIYGRCIYDNCVFDQNEAPKIAHKHWTKCIICNSDLSMDPKLIETPICSKCRAIFLQAENLRDGWECQLCGKKFIKPSPVVFSRICKDCWETLIWHGKCKYYSPTGKTKLKEFDLP